MNASDSKVTVDLRKFSVETQYARVPLNILVTSQFLNRMQKETPYILPKIVPTVLLNQRSQTAGWMYEISTAFNYSKSTYQIALDMLDTVLDDTGLSFDQEDFFLISSTCLYMAIKFNETLFFDLAGMIECFCGGKITKTQVIESEMFILRVLKYSLPSRNVLSEDVAPIVDFLMREKRRSITTKTKSVKLAETEFITKEVKHKEPLNCIFMEAVEAVYAVVCLSYEIARCSPRLEFYLALIYAALVKLEKADENCQFPKGSFYGLSIAAEADEMILKRLITTIDQCLSEFIEKKGFGVESLFDTVVRLFVQV